MLSNFYTKKKINRVKFLNIQNIFQKSFSKYRNLFTKKIFVIIVAKSSLLKYLNKICA